MCQIAPSAADEGVAAGMRAPNGDRPQVGTRRRAAGGGRSRSLDTPQSAMPNLESRLAGGQGLKHVVRTLCDSVERVRVECEAAPTVPRDQLQMNALGVGEGLVRLGVGSLDSGPGRQQEDRAVEVVRGHVRTQLRFGQRPTFMEHGERLQDAAIEEHQAGTVGGGAHRLDFAVRGAQLLERPAPQEGASAPDGPESDLRRLQARHVEGVDALGRGEFAHVAQVLVEQREHVGAGRIVMLDLHTRMHAHAAYRSTGAAAASLHGKLVRVRSIEASGGTMVATRQCIRQEYLRLLMCRWEFAHQPEAGLFQQPD